MQPPGGEKTTNLGREIFSKKVPFTLFYFSILHSFIPNLGVGGVVAGTTPVTIHEEVVSSSKGIGDNCALSTDEIHTSSVGNMGYYDCLLCCPNSPKAWGKMIS